MIRREILRAGRTRKTSHAGGRERLASLIVVGAWRAGGVKRNVGPFADSVSSVSDIVSAAGGLATDSALENQVGRYCTAVALAGKGATA
jgi:hypothetical protein